MARGQGGQAQGAEFDWHAELHFLDAMVRTKAMVVERGGGRCGERELMAGDVVGVGVRDERARLTATDVDGEAAFGQE